MVGSVAFPFTDSVYRKCLVIKKEVCVCVYIGIDTDHRPAKQRVVGC